MKKLFIAGCSIMLVHVCTAQTTKKDEIKFTPPVIVKDKPAIKKASSTATVVKKDKIIEVEQVRLAKPVARKNPPAVKKGKICSPVIVKDKPE